MEEFRSRELFRRGGGREDGGGVSYVEYELSRTVVEIGDERASGGARLVDQHVRHVDAVASEPFGQAFSEVVTADAADDPGLVAEARDRVDEDPGRSARERAQKRARLVKRRVHAVSHYFDDKFAHCPDHDIYPPM